MLDRHMPSTGPTFIKAGQLLAQRMDLLPIPIRRSLEALFDRVTPDRSVDRLVVEKYKDILPPTKDGDHIELLGSGSLSQVYAFRGYAIKVRRPGIADEIESDFEILRRLARLAFCRSVYYTDVLEIIDYLQYSIVGQCDFVEEAKNQMIFYSYRTDNVTVPRIFTEWSDAEMIVMEYVHGTPLHEVKEEQMVALLEKTPSLSQELCQFLTQPLTFNMLFHGDLHPGNVFVTDKGLCILDFGWVCNIDDDVHTVIMETLKLYAKNDLPAIMELLSSNAFHRELTDQNKAELLEILEVHQTADSLVPMVNRLVDYSLEQQLRMDTRYMHILIARLNGYYMFSQLRQDADMVLEMFQKNFTRCAMLKNLKKMKEVMDKKRKAKSE